MPKNENRKGRALIYARFSPRRDAEDCKSCEWQCAECEQYAANHHIPLGEMFVDKDVSGADSVRPTLWNAIHALHKGDTLLVWKWDRLARDLMLQLQIERAVEQRGATVTATVGDIPGNDPQAKFMRHILGAVAELERKMIAQRTSVSMLNQQRRGKRMSYRVPFGWEPDPNDPTRLIENQREQFIRHDILTRRTAGETYDQIAKSLENRGVVSRNGKPISKKLVWNIVRRG